MNAFTQTKLTLCSLTIASTLMLSSTAFASMPVVFVGVDQAAVAQVVTLEKIKVAQEDPYLMIEQAASNTFARIKREQAQIKSDPENLRTIMEEELMPYIDYRFSAFKVLGKYARQVEKKELFEFVSVFREYLITTYAVAMGYYDDQAVEFDPVRDFSDRSDVTVRAVIKDNSSPDIKVAFKVRKDPRSGDWQAYDMIAEELVFVEQTVEFESILRKDGITKVIELMRENIRQPIKLNNGEDTNAQASVDSAARTQ